MATKKAAKSTKTTTKVTTVKKTPVATQEVNQINIPGIFIAEAIGVFVLTLVAILSLQQFGALYTGITYTVLVIALYSISGSHLNPAITLGLWGARKLRTALVPVYWVAQIIGALSAILALNAVSQGGYGLSFDIGQFAWSIFTVELIATAVLLFGVTAAVANTQLNTLGKGVGIGLSLTVALLVGTALHTQAQTTIDTSEVDVTSSESIPHEFKVKGPIVNPAVAIAATENTTEELVGGGFGAEEEDATSRISLEVIFGTLIGALVGSNLFLLVRVANRK